MQSNRKFYRFSDHKLCRPAFLIGSMVFLIRIRFVFQPRSRSPIFNPDFQYLFQAPPFTHFSLIIEIYSSIDFPFSSLTSLSRSFLHSTRLPTIFVPPARCLWNHQVQHDNESKFFFHKFYFQQFNRIFFLNLKHLKTDMPFILNKSLTRTRVLLFLPPALAF